MMPDAELHRQKRLRNKATRENRRRAKAHMAGVANKYRKLKSAMVSGSLAKESFEKGYKIAAMQIATFKQEF